MADKDKKESKVLHIITPFLVLMLCVGIMIPLMIKPYDKLKVYLNIAFMDNLKNDPNKDGSGLIIRDNTEIEEYDGETYEHGSVIRPSFGEQFGVLKCDKLEFDIPVYWGSRTELFERGACQSSGSKLIGTEGNAVVSAHVDTYFADLYKLDKGDSVTILTNYGKFVYTVREQIEFESKNDKYLDSTDDTILTLYTCKKDVFGVSDMRIGVICDLTESMFYNEETEVE